MGWVTRNVAAAVFATVPKSTYAPRTEVDSARSCCGVSSHLSYYQIVGSFHFLLSRLSFFRSRLFSYPLPSSPRYEEALKFFLTAEKSEPGFYKNNQVSEKTRQKKKRIKRKKKKKKKKPSSYIRCGARISEYIQCAYIPSIYISVYKYLYISIQCAARISDRR